MIRTGTGKDLSRVWPLSLTCLVFLADQISKAWVVATIPENSIGWMFFGDFLAIVHVRNTAIAFSMGVGLPTLVKLVGFIVLPLLLLVGVCVLYCSRTLEITALQRWSLALFLGGGTGNLIDRIFRSFRVVDFMSVKVYGFLGFERWPTWNIADASLVISAVLLAISVLITPSDKKEMKDV